jgi:hypothetical protein
MEALDVRIAELSELLERLVASLEPVGRFADRLPGSGRKS